MPEEPMILYFEEALLALRQFDKLTEDRLRAFGK